MTECDPITAVLQQGLAEGVFPGAVLMARRRGTVVYEQAVGTLSTIQPGDPVTTASVYDLASLTKPLATTSATLLLVQEKALSLDRTVASVLPDYERSPVGHATVWHLLTHSAGLPGWRPFYERINPSVAGRPEAKGTAQALLSEETLLHPIGSRSLYSDLGFLLLGWMIERVAEQSLDRFCKERLYDRIPARPLGYASRDDSGTLNIGGVPVALDTVAATEEDARRGCVLRGEVHDDNARALGGVAGHAGLFGTAAAVLAVSGQWLGAYSGKRTLLDGALARQFVTRQEQVAGSSWALGWDTPSSPSSSGNRFSSRSFGHLGYTGTSLWVDPDAELEVVFLSNRVHPTSRNERIRQFRPLLHDVIYEHVVGVG
jgi:CubicO group peptidase (beta-lactamase class C family)